MPTQNPILVPAPCMGSSQLSTCWDYAAICVIETVLGTEGWCLCSPGMFGTTPCITWGCTLRAPQPAWCLQQGCPMSLGWCPCPHLRIRCCVPRVWGETAVSFWAAYLSSELPGCRDSPSARGCSSHVGSQTPLGRCEPMGVCKSVQVLKWRRRRVKKKAHPHL